jgi:proline iminopeptidase
MTGRGAPDRVHRRRDRSIEPTAVGLLPVGDGYDVYWETCGSTDGAPVLILHGGPGSGCRPWHRALFDPSTCRTVLVDQRGCGRGRPLASDPDADLSTNTTARLVADLEILRAHLGIERWAVWGGSWGSTLALAYATSHPDSVSGLILWGVTTGRSAEFDWLFRGGVKPLVPIQWERLRTEAAALSGCSGVLPDREVVDAIAAALFDREEHVRAAAATAWCRWESATLAWPPSDALDERFRDPRFALGFSRLVTHFARHAAFVEDGELLGRADVLRGVPCVMVQGRFDLQAPLGNAWALRSVWPEAELRVIDGVGHALEGAMFDEVVRAGRELVARML